MKFCMLHLGTNVSVSVKFGESSFSGLSPACVQKWSLLDRFCVPIWMFQGIFSYTKPIKITGLCYHTLIDNLLI